MLARLAMVGVIKVLLERSWRESVSTSVEVPVTETSGSLQVWSAVATSGASKVMVLPDFWRRIFVSFSIFPNKSM
jgi:hypothetical protein